MIQFLYGLFYLGVLTLVVGGVAYLFATRDQGRGGRPGKGGWVPPSRASVEKAKGLSGAYRLSDLGWILEQLGSLQAWGMVLELRFTRTHEEIQMTVLRNEVELCGPSLEPADTDLFRRAAMEAGLQARTGYVEEQCCVDVTGTWPKIAGTVRGMIRSIYGRGDGEEVRVKVFD